MTRIGEECEGEMTAERIQHFENLCKETIAEIRRLQEENQRLRETNEVLEAEVYGWKFGF